MENILFFETMTQPKGFLSIIPVIILIILVMVLIGLIIGYLYSMKHTGILIKNNDVIIKTFLYSRKIPISDILINDIQTINLNQNNEYNVLIRTNGIGLPNFYLGWMKLKNGKRALVYLTNKENVLLMPTRDFVVLFSMQNSEEFIRKINELKQ
ncbi:MAG: PH domain-containing protein [Treponema sp.]|nr:PH domain-containing protein [Treponema sp.]